MLLCGSGEAVDGEKYDDVMIDFQNFYGKRSDDLSSDADIFTPKLSRKKLPMVMASLIHLP